MCVHIHKNFVFLCFTSCEKEREKERAHKSNVLVTLAIRWNQTDVIWYNSASQTNQFTERVSHFYGPEKLFVGIKYWHHRMTAFYFSTVAYCFVSIFAISNKVQQFLCLWTDTSKKTKSEILHFFSLHPIISSFYCALSRGDIFIYNSNQQEFNMVVTWCLHF